MSDHSVCGDLLCAAFVRPVLAVGAYGLWLLCAVFLADAIRRRKEFLWFVCRSAVLAFAIAAGSTAFFTVGWNVLIKIGGSSATDGFSAPEREKLFSQIKSLLLGKNDFAASVLERFKINFVQMPVVYNGYGTPAVITLLLTVFGIVFGILLWKKNVCRGTVLALWCMPVFLAAYCGVLLYFYLQMMSDFEALVNASSDRYLASFFIGWIMLVITLTLRCGEKISIPLTKAVQVAAGAAMLMPEADLLLYHNALNLDYTRQQGGRVGFDGVCAQISERLSPEDRVWIVACDLDAEYVYMYHYHLYPAYVFLRELPYTTSEAAFPENDEELDALLEQNRVDHLVVYNVNDKLMERFSGRFSDGLTYVEENSLPCLYQVEADGTFALITETTDVKSAGLSG